MTIRLEYNFGGNTQLKFKIFNYIQLGMISSYLTVVVEFCLPFFEVGF